MTTFLRRTQCICSKFQVLSFGASLRYYSPSIHQFFLKANAPHLFQFIRKISSYEEPTSEVPSYYDRYIFPEPPELISEEEHDTVVERVNNCIANPDRGRLFAIVLIAGRQYKITDHDLVQTSGFMVGAEVGDRLRLERVLLVGGQEFTLIGRPILRRSLVKVEATVIEKTPNADQVIQYFIPRKSFQRRYIYTPISTVLRINSVQAFPEL